MKSGVAIGPIFSLTDENTETELCRIEPIKIDSLVLFLLFKLMLGVIKNMFNVKLIKDHKFILVVWSISSLIS